VPRKFVSWLLSSRSNLCYSSRVTTRAGGSPRRSTRWMARAGPDAGQFLPPMDSAIVNVPIRTSKGPRGGRTRPWISTAYPLGLAVFVPLSNWLTDRCGLTGCTGVALIGFWSVPGCAVWPGPEQLDRVPVLTAVPRQHRAGRDHLDDHRIVPRESIGTAHGPLRAGRDRRAEPGRRSAG